jgi:hypothetical protein
MKTLHIGVFGRLARMAEVEVDTPLAGLLVYHLGDELAAVV